MARLDNLANLERQAWRSNFDDGLLDLLLGGMLLLLGIASMVPNDRLLYPFYFGLVAVYVTLKWRVVIPRAGLVRFAAPRRRRKALTMGVLLSATILGTVVMVLLTMDGAAAAWLRTHPIVFEAGFPLMVATVFSALAVLLDVARIHALGVVFALAFGIRMWFDMGIGFLAGGAMVMLVGVALFARFLHTHPVMSAKEHKAEARHVR
jgi:hypothetical protein